MKMYCQNRFCDFEFEDNPSGAMPMSCPKCGGTSFGTTKEQIFSGAVIVSEPPAFWLEASLWDSSSMNWGRK